MRRVLSALLMVALAGPPAQLSAQAAVLPAQTTDPELAKGIRQVDEGDFDAALITIDGAVRRLQGQPNRSRDLSAAYLYLGIAYLGLSQEQAARMRFLEAVKQNQSLQLDPKEYPPRVVQLFQDARREMGVQAAPRPYPTATSPAPRVAMGQVDDPPVRPSPPPAQDEGGGGSKTLLIVGGVLVVGGVAAALALSGGGGDGGGDTGPRTMTFTSTDVPRPIRDFTTTNSTLSVSGLNGSIVSVSVNVSIIHTFIGDLEVGLRSPAGTEVILHNNEGGSIQNINRQYSPVGFNGQQANGVWTLRVSDEAGADIGQISSWSLTITVQR